MLDACQVESTETSRLQDSVERAFSLAQGVCKVIVGETEYLYAAERICLKCAYSFPEVEPRLFSFNSPIGACEIVMGLGVVYDTANRKVIAIGHKESLCKYCEGKRLNKAALAVKINSKNIYDLGELSIKALCEFFNKLELDSKSTCFSSKIIARDSI